MSGGKQRLLLIRGLGHSGTTILDLALGAHPQITGLGEALRLLEKPAAKDSHRGPAQLRGALRYQRHCTCGLVADACPVWGPILRWLPAHDDQPLPAKLKRLLAALEPSAAGPGMNSWVVESYQDDFVLPLLEDPALEIRVIHLTRDVRSWVHSRSRDGRQRGRCLVFSLCCAGGVSVHAMNGSCRGAGSQCSVSATRSWPCGRSRVCVASVTGWSWISLLRCWLRWLSRVATSSLAIVCVSMRRKGQRFSTTLTGSPMEPG